MNSRIVLVTVCLTVAMGIVLHSSAGSPTKPGDVTESRVTAEASDGNNWLLNGRTFDEQHFSPLKQITKQNVGQLRMTWTRGIGAGQTAGVTTRNEHDAALGGVPRVPRRHRRRGSGRCTAAVCSARV